jgi:uncharacterized membrane protein YphA (DoxX/SURF4 family)
MVDYDRLKENAPAVARIGLSLVFLWFSISQFIAPDSWMGYIPSFLSGFSNLIILIYMNAAFELVFGAMLLLGVFTRVSALLLGLHLIGIVFSLRYNEIAIRDFGLMMACFSVFMNGPDRLCIWKN